MNNNCDFPPVCLCFINRHFGLILKISSGSIMLAAASLTLADVRLPPPDKIRLFSSRNDRVVEEKEGERGETGRTGKRGKKK